VYSGILLPLNSSSLRLVVLSRRTIQVVHGFYNGVAKDGVGGKCSGGRDLSLTCEGLLVADCLKSEVKR
jgi:hypothetical protein